jgi:glycosyltransferase involved in cell wall biosynthesis
VTTGTGDPASGRTLWYLCLELPVEGQASHTHVMGILRGLDARGWRTRLWSPRPRRGRRGAARRLFDSVTLQVRLILQWKRPDVLYVRGHFLSLPTLLWARLRRVPVVWELNGAGTDVLSSWPRARRILPLLNASADWQMRLSSTAIGVTPALARWADEHGARASHVVGNGADTELFSPGASTTETLPDKFVSFTGTLTIWQGLDSVFAAMDRPAWPRDVGLVVIGDGVLADVVRERADADPRVRYLGRLPHGEVAGVVARSFAALSPMYAADRIQIGVVPLKLFEAMACGVAVIVTDLPGQADIVTLNACGIVVPPNDPEAIAAAVARLAAEPDLARSMGDRARAGAVGRYSWDAAAARTHAILVDLLDG